VDVLQAANPADRSFDAEAKAAVWHAAILAQIDVLLIRLHRQAVLMNARDQSFGIRHALGTTDDFTISLRCE